MSTNFAVKINRPFPNCLELNNESEISCIVLVMISLHSHPSKANFHMKSLALILECEMRFKATQKWPVVLGMTNTLSYNVQFMAAVSQSDSSILLQLCYRKAHVLVP